MRNELIVFNPMGLQLARCDNPEQAQKIIKWHCKKVEKHRNLLSLPDGVMWDEKSYSIKNINDIIKELLNVPKYDEIKMEGI